MCVEEEEQEEEEERSGADWMEVGHFVTYVVELVI